MSDSEEDVVAGFNHDFARASLLLDPILLPAENAAIAIQREVCYIYLYSVIPVPSAFS